MIQLCNDGYKRDWRCEDLKRSTVLWLLKKTFLKEDSPTHLKHLYIFKIHNGVHFITCMRLCYSGDNSKFNIENSKFESCLRNTNTVFHSSATYKVVSFFSQDYQIILGRIWIHHEMLNFQ